MLRLLLWSLLCCLPSVIDDLDELLWCVTQPVLTTHNHLPLSQQEVWNVVIRQESLLKVVDFIIFSLSEQFIFLKVCAIKIVKAALNTYKFSQFCLS